MKSILAKKLNMTQVFTEDGKVMPVTVLSVDKDVKLEDLQPGDVVDIKGSSKGRGFAGVMKRHGFHGAPASHGHDHPRAVGSIGQMFPQHVRPGLRMAGRMGGGKATVKHSIVVAIEPGSNLLFVKGGVPGAYGQTVKVAAVGKKKEIGKITQYGTAEPDKSADEKTKET